jgi:hypothetical protein
MPRNKKKKDGISLNLITVPKEKEYGYRIQLKRFFKSKKIVL